MSTESISTVSTIDPSALRPFEREAIREFCATARANGDTPVTCEEAPGCGLFLVGEAAEAFGEDCPALAVCEDELGNWTALIRRPNCDHALLTCQFIGGRDVR